MKFRANDAAPVTWCPLRRACVCDLCGEAFKGGRQPTDRGSYPERNRARGKAIAHVNAAHPDDEGNTP